MQVIPGNNRIAVLRNPGNLLATFQLKEIEAAARSFGLQIHLVDFRAPGELDGAFANISGARIAGALFLSDPMIFGQRRRLAELAMKYQIPHDTQRPGVSDGRRSYVVWD